MLRISFLILVTIIALVEIRIDGAPVRSAGREKNVSTSTERFSDSKEAATSAIEPQISPAGTLHRYESFPPYVEGTLEQYFPSPVPCDQYDEAIPHTPKSTQKSKKRLEKGCQYKAHDKKGTARHNRQPKYVEMPDLSNLSLDEEQCSVSKWLSETNREEDHRSSDASHSEQPREGYETIYDRIRRQASSPLQRPVLPINYEEEPDVCQISETCTDHNDCYR